jgi:hypothetical protein
MRRNSPYKKRGAPDGLSETLKVDDFSFQPRINQYYTGTSRRLGTADIGSIRERFGRLPDLNPNALAKKLKEEGVNEFLKFNTMHVEKLLEEQRHKDDEEEY